MDNLLSGAIGALVATCVTIFYHFKSEQIDNRKHAIRLIVEWLDEFYTTLQLLSAHKEMLFTENTESMASQEYQTFNNKLRLLVLTEKVPAETRCVFGNNNIFKDVTFLKEKLTEVARLFWAGKSENWDQTNKSINKLFNDEIDPVRNQIMLKLFKSIELKSFVLS